MQMQKRQNYIKDPSSKRCFVWPSNYGDLDKESGFSLRKHLGFLGLPIIYIRTGMQAPIALMHIEPVILSVDFIAFVSLTDFQVLFLHT